MSAVVAAQSAMSPGLSCLLVPLSGSSLVTEESTKPAAPEPPSVSVTRVETRTSFRFAGQSLSGRALHVSCGAVRSILNATVRDSSTLSWRSTER